MPFCLKTLQDLGRVYKCETCYLQEYAIEILSNSDPLKILNLRLTYLNVSSLRNEGFKHLKNIRGQGIPAFADYSMGNAINMKYIFNKKIIS